MRKSVLYRFRQGIGYHPTKRKTPLIRVIAKTPRRRNQNKTRDSLWRFHLQGHRCDSFKFKQNDWQKTSMVASKCVRCTGTSMPQFQWGNLKDTSRQLNSCKSPSWVMTICSRQSISRTEEKNVVQHAWHYATMSADWKKIYSIYDDQDFHALYSNGNSAHFEPWQIRTTICEETRDYATII